MAMRPLLALWRCPQLLARIVEEAGDAAHSGCKCCSLLLHIYVGVTRPCGSMGGIKMRLMFSGKFYSV